MDTYKKKYEEALERAKEYHSVDIDNTMDVKARGIMEYLFPELKINEDEKIRKRISQALHGDVLDFDEIIQADTWLEKQGECHISHDDEIMIKQLTEYFTTGHGLQNTNETVVEWLNDVKEKLEKQGEQKPNPCDECINVKGCINCENGELRETEQKPAVKMKTPEESLGIDSDTYNEIVDKCIYGEQKSQRMISAEAKEAMYAKTAWSEEDEEMYKMVETAINSYYAPFSRDSEEMLEWLKSLKDRYTWKPSDAQMASIICAVRKMKESACYDSELVSLLNDLKKLREE